MTIQQLVVRERSRLLREKSQLERLLVESPPGTLTFSKNKSKGRTYYKWYVRNDFPGSGRSKAYLSRKDRHLAKILAEKSLRQARLNDIEQELKALDAYLDKHSDSSFWSRLANSPGFGELCVGEEILTSPELSAELERWAQEEYEISPYHPEERNVPTEQGIYVRSKSEAIILMLLTMYHIPFRYECRLDVAGHTYYPDFTIRHPLTGEVFYWEHVGRLDDPGYRSDFLNKFRTYINSGILPDHNLILTFESDGHPLDISIVMDKFREFFFCNKQELN